MPYSNSENVVWNDAHEGKRVPINDTDSEGAPFNLSGNNPSWEDGSIGKAVYETHIIQDSPQVFSDDIQASGYVFRFKDILKYLINDMLYGYSEDARNTVPGDMMSLRGYPTCIITSESLTLHDADAEFKYEPDGSQTDSGEWSIVYYEANIKYKLPYDFVFDVTFKKDAVSEVVLNVRIEKGNLGVTHYYDDVALMWKPVTDNKVYFSTDTSGDSGQINVSALANKFLQAPYYGTIAEQSVLIDESAYRPGGSPPTISLGGGIYFGWPYNEYVERKDACREVSDDDLLGTTPSNLYMDPGDTLEVGTQLYSNKAGTVTASPGSYVSVIYEYEDITYGSIYVILWFILVDASGIVTYYDAPEQGYLEADCYSLWRSIEAS